MSVAAPFGNSPFPQAKVLVRLRDIAAGMSYLHSRNVLHGDLKAANVLLASSQTAPFGMVAKVRPARGGAAMCTFAAARLRRVRRLHRDRSALLPCLVVLLAPTLQSRSAEGHAPVPLVGLRPPRRRSRAPPPTPGRWRTSA
jgi:serine/threonine protein kinase